MEQMFCSSITWWRLGCREASRHRSGEAAERLAVRKARLRRAVHLHPTDIRGSSSASSALVKPRWLTASAHCRSGEIEMLSQGYHSIVHPISVNDA
jgi:hypothetical protein